MAILAVTFFVNVVASDSGIFDQLGAEQFSASVQSGTDSPYWAINELGDLLVGEAFDITQDHDGAEIFGKRFHGTSQIVIQEITIETCFHVVRVGVFRTYGVVKILDVFVINFIRLFGFLAVNVDVRVLHDPEKPRLAVGARLELIPKTIRLHICLLQEIVGVVGIAGHAQREIIKRSDMRHRFALEVLMPFTYHFIFNLSDHFNFLLSLFYSIQLRIQSLPKKNMSRAGLFSVKEELLLCSHQYALRNAFAFHKNCKYTTFLRPFHKNRSYVMVGLSKFVDFFPSSLFVKASSEFRNSSFKTPPPSKDTKNRPFVSFIDDYEQEFIIPDQNHLYIVITLERVESNRGTGFCTILFNGIWFWGVFYPILTSGVVTFLVIIVSLEIMSFTRYFVIGGFLCAILQGCATIFNGKTQDVPLRLPEGAEIYDLDSARILDIQHNDSGAFLRLKRNREYNFRLKYKGEEFRLVMPRSFEAKWLLPDYLCLVVPILIDIATGAWHSFDGVIVHFPSDTSDSLKSEQPLYEIIEQKRGKVMACLSICDVFPSSIFLFLPNGFAASIGYEISRKVTGLLTAEQSGADLIMPDHSEYFDLLTNFTSYQLEARYKISGDVYAVGGGGLTQFGVDSLNYYSTDSLHSKITVPGLTKYLGSVFVGLGLSLQSFFFEIRHSLGFSKIAFPNGERGRYETTGVRAGLVLRF